MATTTKQEKTFTFTGRIPYKTNTEASMVMAALDVDEELKPELVTRELTVEGYTLVMNFKAVDAKALRAAVGTFCDLLALASKTLEEFPAID